MILLPSLPPFQVIMMTIMMLVLLQMATVRVPFQMD